jgi:hypothetical protein
VLTLVPKVGETINSVAGLEKRAYLTAAIKIRPIIADAGHRSITLLGHALAARAPEARSTQHGALLLIDKALSRAGTYVLRPLPDANSSRRATPRGRDRRATDPERVRACAGRRRRQAQQASGSRRRRPPLCAPGSSPADM